MTRKKQYMDFGLFRKVVDMLTESGLAVKNPLAGLHLLGEPLLHPEIDRFIDYMNVKGLATDLVTNGLLLTPAVIDRLSTRNVARITVSIQSPGPESYRESRGDSSKSWDEYIEGIRRAVVRYLKVSRRQPAGGILRLDVLYMTTFNYNPNMKGLRSWTEVRELLSEWSGLAAGVCPEASLVCDTGYEADGIRKFQICRLNDKVFNLSVREAGTWAGSLEAHRHVEPVTAGSCSVPNSQLIVLASGDVTVCCVDYHNKWSEIV